MAHCPYFFALRVLIPFLWERRKERYENTRFAGQALWVGTRSWGRVA